jgi:SAM-dependent methyltransferase
MHGTVFEALPYRGQTLSRRLRYFGLRRYCPVCASWSSGFAPFGFPVRQNARCKICGALERHRMLWHYLRRVAGLKQGGQKRLLHFAPVPVLRDKFEALPTVTYLTADRYDPHVNARLDITRLPIADNSVDIVICSHVLEHIPDDRCAMSEIGRILTADGQALFMVPFTRSLTLEALDADPQERERLFNNPYHVRDYGWDLLLRLAESGFEVAVVHPYDVLTPLQVALFAPLKTDYIFVGRKQSA